MDVGILCIKRTKKGFICLWVLPPIFANKTILFIDMQFDFFLFHHDNIWEWTLTLHEMLAQKTTSKSHKIIDFIIYIKITKQKNPFNSTKRPDALLPGINFKLLKLSFSQLELWKQYNRSPNIMFYISYIEFCYLGSYSVCVFMCILNVC